MKFQKSRLLSAFALTSSLLIVSCASNKEPEGGIVKSEFPAQKQAPVKIEDSFDFSGAEGSLIKIRRDSLKKTFLMAMTLSTGDNASRRNVLMPKLVKFELNGSELGLLEENYNSIYKEIPTGKLLQTFKVESQDADSVTFRWSYGLAAVPTKGFYVVSDAGAEGLKEATDSSEEVLPVTATFLRSAQVRNNRLELRQLSKVSNLEALLDDKTKKIATGVKASDVQLDIAISPYVQNKRFQPRLSTKTEGVGFFEIAKVREGQGPLDIYASRWDLSEEAGPITYKISKSSPPEAVEAMKDGILYWNNVFKAALGREIIKVEVNADPNEPLQHRSVMVHWVEYSTAGSAYANFQPDPLTGEITSGLVYQTSVFFLSGKQRGRRFVNRGVENRPRQVAPAGFRSAEICDFRDPHDLSSTVAAEDLDEKMSLKFATDYLRHVVAHEVGHTLGLRHNFAGSLASEMKTPAENREKFKEYLADANHPGALPTSSVMEYSTFRDSIMEGAALKTAALPYDQAAVKWGYGKDYVKPENIVAPLFCTDVEGSNAKTFGCSTDDTGPRPVAGHAAGVARNKALAADIILEALLDAIRPENENDAVSVRKALASNHPDKLSAAIGVELPHFARLGGAGMKHIVVDRKNKGANWANQEAYAKETQEEIAKEFNEAGGLPGILKVAYDLDDGFRAKKGWLLEAVRERTSRASFGRGKNLGGRAYELTPDEIKDVKAASERLADAVEAAFLRDVLLAVTGLTPAEVSGGAGRTTPAALVAYPETMKAWAPYVVQDSWQAGLGALVAQLAVHSEGEVEGTVDGATVKVPAPQFPIEARLAAMRLFSPKVFGGRTPDAWLKDHEAEISKTMIERLAPVVKVDPSNVDKVEPAGKAISKELLDWAKKEHAVLKALKAARK